MKKLILSISLLVAVISSSNAQVLFHGAETLKKGNWQIGINPVVETEWDNDFALFFHGGYGLGNNSDLGVKLGLGWWNETYFGLDYEKTLLLGKPSVSVAGGMHFFNDFGLDLTALVTFPINNVRIATGLDADIVFGEDANGDTEVYTPIWLPIHLEVYIKKQISIVVEGNVSLNNDEPYSWTTFGGGVNIYF